jgi:hypothetical protein
MRKVVVNGFSAALIAGAMTFSFLVPAARGATVTNLFTVNFDGSVSGSTYSGDSGYGGAMTVDSPTAPSTDSFINDSGRSVVSSNATGPNDFGLQVSVPSGTYTNQQNYVLEAVINPGSPTAINSSNNVAGLQSVISIDGQNGSDTGALVLRLTPGNHLEAAYDPIGYVGFDPSPTVIIPTGQYTHVALVYTYLGSGQADIDLYVNGSDVGSTGSFATATNDIFNGGVANVLNANADDDGGAYNRGFNGDVDSAAVSTFTGTFNPATDFVLSVPEPASLAFIGMIGTMGLLHRRGRHAGA